MSYNELRIKFPFTQRTRLAQGKESCFSQPENQKCLSLLIPLLIRVTPVTCVVFEVLLHRSTYINASKPDRDRENKNEMPPLFLGDIK